MKTVTVLDWTYSQGESRASDFCFWLHIPAEVGIDIALAKVDEARSKGLDASIWLGTIQVDDDLDGDALGDEVGSRLDEIRSTTTASFSFRSRHTWDGVKMVVDIAQGDPDADSSPEEPDLPRGEPARG